MDNNKDDIPCLLLPREVSERTGISVYRIRQWIKSGDIVYVPFGRKKMVNYTEFLNFRNKGSKG